MKKLFSGNKKFLTIPAAFLFGLLFLPIVIFLLIGWLINSKVKNESLKFAGLLVVSIVVLFFGSAYVVAFVSPSPQSPSQGIKSVVIEATPGSIIPTPVSTINPTEVPINLATPTPTPEPTMTPNPTIEPTLKPNIVYTPKPTTSYSFDTPSSSYICNCSKTCPQMSCSEAQYQLNVCGCSRRDGDGDGLACDSQCQ